MDGLVKNVFNSLINELTRDLCKKAHIAIVAIAHIEDLQM